MKPTVFLASICLTLVASCLIALPISADTPSELPTDKQALEQAARALNSITGKDAITSKVRELALNPDYSRKLLKVATEMAKDPDDSPFSYTATTILGRVALSLRDVPSGEKFFKQAASKAGKLGSQSKVYESYMGLINLYYLNRDFAKSAKLCQELLSLPGEEIRRRGPFIMERLIECQVRDGKFEEARKLTNNLVEADDGGWYFLRLKAWVQREAGEPQESVKTYLEALRRLREAKLSDEELKQGFTEEIRYQLSSSYVELNKIDRAAQQLEILIKQDPDNPTYYNDLGYIWADNDMNLDKSEKLVRKALELDRKQKEEVNAQGDLAKPNAAYLDSLAWVLFKKKDYQEAKKYLLEAVEQEEGQHIEILDHLAEVHLALGETDKAIKVWEESLERKPENNRERERRKQVEAKLKKYRQ